MKLRLLFGLVLSGLLCGCGTSNQGNQTVAPNSSHRTGPPPLTVHATAQIRFIAFSLRDRLLRTRCIKLLVDFGSPGPLEIGGANGKIQKTREQTEAQPDGA